MPQSVVRGRRKFCASVNSSKGKPATERLVHKGLGAESEEKREPVSDIDTGVVGSLKVLDPAGRLEKPISRQRWEAVGPGSKKPERLAFDGRGRKVNQHPSLFERQDSTLVAWYRSIYAPRTGGAYDSHIGRRELLAALGGAAAAWPLAARAAAAMQVGGRVRQQPFAKVRGFLGGSSPGRG